MSTTVSYVRDKQTILLKRVATLEKAKDRVLVYGEPLFLKDLNIIVIGDGILDKHDHQKDESYWTVTGSTVQELYDAKKYFISAKPGTLYGVVNYDTVNQGGATAPTKENIKSLAGDTKLANTKYVTDVKNQVFAVVDDEKMAKANPTGTGSISINRLASSVVGTNSAVFGTGNVASGLCSFAEGAGTTASGDHSHAEGSGTTANGAWSHAEGSATTTSAAAMAAHAEGRQTLASSGDQHVQGKYNIEDAANKYADIVGNGSGLSRSNAFALDWDGNGYYAGKVYANHDFTSNVDPQKMLINAGIVAGEYDSRATYSVGQLVFSDNRLYRCKSPVIGHLMPIAPPGVAWEEVTINDVFAKYTYDQLKDGTTEHKPSRGTQTPKGSHENTAGSVGGANTWTYSREDHIHPSDSTKADKSNTVTNVAWDSANSKITKTINGTSTDVVTAATLKTAMALNNVTNESKATMFTSPTFTGTPKLSETPSASDSSTRIATTAMVHTVMANYGQVIFYQATQPDIPSMPLTPAEKEIPRIWINSNTGIAKVWTGTSTGWKSVYSIWG